MPETFQSLVVLLLVLIPGALYVWAFERYAGAWGARFSDRVFRFVEFSALLHALAAPITYRLWTDFIRTGRLGAGDAPAWLWLVPLAYVVVPILVGSVIGHGTPRAKAVGDGLHRSKPGTEGMGPSVRLQSGWLDPPPAEEWGLARRRIRSEA